MNKRLLGVCLVCTTASMFAQRPSKPTERLAVVRQIDHIIVHTNTVQDAKSLWSVFAKTLNLPIAWPPTTYEGFFSGGVNAGSVNLEFAYSNEESPAPPSTRTRNASARFSGLGLEPEPLPLAVAELDRLGVGHGKPDAYQAKDETGNKLTLWTTLYLDELSRNMDIFLCEYRDDLFRRDKPPRRNIQENRRYLKDQLKQRDGGPLGVDSVKEVVIETSDYEATVNLWEKLLNEKVSLPKGELKPEQGPTIHLVPSATDGIQSIVVRVADLDRARRFLKENGLLGHNVRNGIAIDPAKLMGIDVQVVQ